MKKDKITIYKEIVYPTTRQLIRKRYPPMLPYFKRFWGNLITLLKWKDSGPETFISEYYQRPHIGSPPTFEEGTRLRIFSIALALYASLEDLVSIDYELNRDKFADIVQTNGDKYHVPHSIIPDIVSILSKLLSVGKRKYLKRFFLKIAEEEKVEKTKTGAIKKEPYAKIWTLTTGDPENGDIVSKEEYKRIWERRKSSPLLIIKRNGFKTVYVRGDDRDLTLLLYDLLEYFLKHKGNGGDIINLLKHVWKCDVLAEDYRKELDGAKKVGADVEKRAKLFIYSKTSHIRKTITMLNHFLYENFKVEIKSLKKGQYKLTRPLNYHLIEII